MRQSTSITGCVRWLVGRLVCWSVGNAFVRRSTRRTLLAYLALFKSNWLADSLMKDTNTHYQMKPKQVTWGHNVVASPQPHPQPPSNTLTHKQYQLQHHKYAFFTFSTRAWQVERDQRTDGWTDKASYRVAVKNEISYAAAETRWARVEKRLDCVSACIEFGGKHVT